MKHRFRFIQIDHRSVRNERLNINENLKIAIYEDLKTSKLHEIPNRVSRNRLLEFGQLDLSAVLLFQGIEEEVVQFRVLEGESFHLPGESNGLLYRMKSVSAQSVTVEWQEEGQAMDLEVQVSEAEADH